MSRANNRTSNRLHRLTNPRRAGNSDSEGRAGKDSTNSRVPLLERDRARIAIIEPSRVIKAIDVAEHCVLCFFQEVIAELVREGAQARHVHNGESEAGDYPVYELDYGGRRLAIVHPGVGASSAAARLEHMIALGCRKFVACGGAGVLVGSISVGHIVVPTAAIRDEGTSYHYLPPAREVAPTRRALEAVGAMADQDIFVADAHAQLAASGAIDKQLEFIGGADHFMRAGGSVLRGGTLPPCRVRGNPLWR